MAEFILKDWYGKEQTFDKEMIYVQGKDGELIPFSLGTGNPVIEPLEVSENGTYEAPDGVDGYSPVTVEVPDPVINRLEVTKNGTYSPQAGVDGYGPVVVNVPDVPAVVRSLEVTKNGTYTAPSGVDGYSPVTVTVPGPVLQAKEVTKNGEYKPDSGYDGLSKVTVNVPAPVLEPLIVTENGNYTPGAGKDGFNSVTVAVQAPEIKLQEKTITENGAYTADAGFDGLAKVLVDVAGSGGAKYYKINVGEWDANRKTITHNLGVVPDLVILLPYTPVGNVGNTASMSGDGLLACAASTDGKMFSGSRYAVSISVKSGKLCTQNDTVGYFAIQSDYGDWISRATETTVSIPPRVAGIAYSFIAVAGIL